MNDIEIQNCIVMVSGKNEPEPKWIIVQYVITHWLVMMWTLECVPIGVTFAVAPEVTLPCEIKTWPCKMKHLSWWYF